MKEGVRISADLVAEMITHCELGRPNEACGIFGSANGEVVKVFRMSNAARSPVRYSLDPAEQFAVYKSLEEEGWELGGVFHSHTHTEAWPSPTDIRLASEDVPYVIVSLAEDPPQVRAFRISKANWTDEQGEVEEVPVTVLG
ncbi:MAG TPA: M67 family metallopeptidase [Actinomycetota bacterium]|jgi:proteasome lid subunit RPN8/RPN11|nr:M67 family metallopeptidase [Actinomycetota bacterium]